MLDRVRATGKPITPQMQKMAEWMDKMEQDGASGEPPMLKPGEGFAVHRARLGPGGGAPHLTRDSLSACTPRPRHARRHALL